MVRFVSAFLLTLAFLFSAAQCWCRLAVQEQECHVQVEMTDCCCSEQGEVTDARPDLPPALLVSGPKVPVSNLDALLQVDPMMLAVVFQVREVERPAQASVRSSPALYLLNTSFLI